MKDVNGQLPFEGDNNIAREILKLKETFNIKAAFETGSQYGATLEWFKNNFKEHFGCEINREFYSTAKQKGLNVFNVDSLTFLNNMTHQIKERNTVLFYIDSHWHDTPCPLKDELTMIADLKVNPIICIHDFKVPNREDLGYDSYDYDLKFEEIELYLQNIYPKGYEYHYNDVAEGAKRGIIFIYPKK